MLVAGTQVLGPITIATKVRNSRKLELGAGPGMWASQEQGQMPALLWTFFFKGLPERVTEIEGERQIFSICWFIPQMVTMARLKPPDMFDGPQMEGEEGSVTGIWLRSGPHDAR